MTEMNLKTPGVILSFVEGRGEALRTCFDRLNMTPVSYLDLKGILLILKIRPILVQATLLYLQSCLLPQSLF